MGLPGAHGGRGASLLGSLTSGLDIKTKKKINKSCMNRIAMAPFAVKHGAN